MPKFVKGQIMPARRPRSEQKYPTELKEMILEALYRAGGNGEHGPKGGVEYLRNQAIDNPVAFMSLLGRVLPLTIQGTGKDGEFLLTINAPEAKVF